MLKPIVRRILLCVVIFFVAAVNLTAQDRHSVGLYNSPAGFGLSYTFTDKQDNEGKTVNLVADMYGIYSGINKFPGIIATYINNKLYKDYGNNIGLYFGIGFAAGYVRDIEANALPWQRAPLTKNYGVMGGVAVGWGARFSFEHNIYMDLGLQAIAGLHFRSNEDGDGIIISFYKNGLLQAVCPVLRIQYRF